MQNIVTILLKQQQKLLIVLALMSLILCSSTAAAPRTSRMRSGRRILRGRRLLQTGMEHFKHKYFVSSPQAEQFFTFPAILESRTKASQLFPDAFQNVIINYTQLSFI